MSSKERGGVSYIKWTEERKLLLTKYVCAYEAYIRTGETFEIKYSKVIAILKSEPEFTGVTLTFPSIQYTFKRFQNIVLEDKETSKESANSPCEEMLTLYEKLMLNMARETEERTRKRKRAKEIALKAKKESLTNKRVCLNNQGEMISYSPATTASSSDFTPIAELVIDPDSEDSISDISNVSSTASKKRCVALVVKKLMNEIWQFAV